MFGADKAKHDNRLEQLPNKNYLIIL